MPLAARRMGRAGVIGPRPVARTAATVGTVAVVAHGVNRRTRPARRPTRRPQGPSPLSRPGAKLSARLAAIETSGRDAWTEQRGMKPA